MRHELFLDYAALLGSGATGFGLGWAYFWILKRWMRRQSTTVLGTARQDARKGVFIRLGSVALVLFLLSRISKSFLIGTSIGFVGGFTLFLLREVGRVSKSG